MIRTSFVLAAVLAFTTSMAWAQERDLPAKDLPQNGGAGVRSGNITSTGATVPNPGASQGAGTTSLDRGIQERDNQITRGICKGC